MKILRPFTGTGAVFWPIGPLPQGTCEFATTACRKHCYAALPEWPDFDEEIRVPEADKQMIRAKMLSLPISTLRWTLLAELDGLQTDILHWFGSGDCPRDNIDRVLRIIEAMDGDCVQMGFTRNEELWKARKDVFALTVESVEEICGREGLFSVSDFANGTSIMHRNGTPTRGGYCGPELCADRIEPRLTHFINCQACKRMRIGCFDNAKLSRAQPERKRDGRCK